MKRIIHFIISVAVLLPLSTCIATAKKISIFCDHIYSISQQENITFAEAASKIREIGYSGVDVEVTIPKEHQFERILIVPDLMNDDTKIEDVVSRVVPFAERTQAIGTISTYPISLSPRLRRVVLCRAIRLTPNAPGCH